MRLINTQTLDMEEFTPSEVPDYAILSHTWGDDEITFQEMIRARGVKAVIIRLRAKRGYRKIENFCKQARNGAVKYVWMDTCCIDKRSSAELSEAINSMFKFYEGAGACCIYLADVSVSDAGGDRKQLLDSISKSRWLSRGWTLQELIAQSNRVFFDGGWNLIDGGDDLLSAISEATNIPKPVLTDGTRQGEYCVAERMSWASRRNTTRPEDMAYCLMGMFNVNMPIIYGEGPIKAFKRLQVEIMQSSFDQTLFAWRGNCESSGLLASSPSYFANTPPLLLWTPLHIAQYQMTNVGLSIQVLDITNDRDPERRRELQDLRLLGLYDHDTMLAAIQCHVRGTDTIVQSVGIQLEPVDSSFRSSPEQQVTAYRRVDCNRWYPIPPRLLTNMPFRQVLVLEDAHWELLEKMRNPHSSQIVRDFVKSKREEWDMQLYGGPFGTVAQRSAEASGSKNVDEQTCSDADATSGQAAEDGLPGIERQNGDMEDQKGEKKEDK